MKIASCIARCLTALIAVTVSSVSAGFDRSERNNIASRTDAEKNHFILCAHRHRCTEAEGWVATAGLKWERTRASAALLPDGKVLLAAGWGPQFVCLASAELYDPVTSSWGFTGSMHVPRTLATTTLLPDSKVMVIGGFVPHDDYESGITAAAEIYDPGTGLWSLTGSMHRVRASHTATLLQNGKVLVVGGASDYEVVDSVELYDPGTGNWSPAASLATGPREDHTATLLQDGRVLVAGGKASYYWKPLASAELYDPSTETWNRVSDMGTPRVGHTATVLPNGKVLVAGGANQSVGSLVTAELFDPATGLWTATGDLNEGRGDHTATVLPDGNVLVVAGAADGDRVLSRVVNGTEIYDTASGAWRRGAELSQGRFAHTATLLSDGTVLVAGGAEIFNATASSYQTRPIGSAERSQPWR